MFKTNPLKNLPQTTSYPIQISNDLKYVQEFWWILMRVFCLLFIKGDPSCYLYPVKFLILNTTTVTRDNEGLSEIKPIF